MTVANQWTSAAHVDNYLSYANDIPHRAEGEGVVLELLPSTISRVLDLGTGDGRLLALVKAARPNIIGIGIDFSPAMLAKVRQRFASDPAIQIMEHNLEQPLPDLGTFDAIISSFAIHHVPHERKAPLYREVFDRLSPGGIFINLEHVMAPTPKLRDDFFRALGTSLAEEDPSNKCIGIEPQLEWLRQAGFTDVDCYWKWRELGLLAGVKPA